MNKNKINKILTIILLFTLLLGALSSGGSGNISNKSSSLVTPLLPVEENMNIPWFQKTQVYDMVALPPSGIEKFHITVNGLWNGYFAGGLCSPFAYGRWLESYYSGETYESDEEFVQSQHDEGMIVPASILTTQGHESFQGEQLEEFACRSVNGEMADWSVGESYWMNSNDPNWINWTIEHGKKAIDAGADMICLDEIQGNGFIPSFQYLSQFIDFTEPGFSDCTLNGFREYLQDKFTEIELQNLYEIDNVQTYDFRSRIANTMYLDYDSRIAEDPLIEEYIAFNEIGNFHAKKRLIQELRNYAEDQGKDIVIGANSFALGTNRLGGYWAKGLQFSDMLDLFIFENEYTAIEDVLIPEFPQNKWLAWEKLARAATGAPPVVLLAANTFASISPIEKPLCFEKYFTNYLSILCAEAYANRGSFVNWYSNNWPKPENWDGCAKTYGFVLDHQDLYDARSIIDTPVAILYLYGEGMRTKTDTYLGLAQALAESNIPFEVVFDGDGFYLNESLTLEKLSNYSFILIPSVLDITDSQEAIIKEYVHNGGKALVFNPEEIGFDPVEGEMEYGNGSFIFMLQDKGTKYYHMYTDDLRQDIENVVMAYTDDVITVENADRKIVAYPYFQPTEDRVVIHLVNYDHTKSNDAINPKEDVRIRMKKPSFDVGGIYVISPDFEGKILIEPIIGEEYVDFVVPSLEIYDVIVIKEQSDTKSSMRIEQPEESCLYIFGKKVATISSEKTIIFGEININVVMQDERIELSKVAFYIDDIPRNTDTYPPYEWLWDERTIGAREIKVVAYDNEGNTASDSQEVWIFNI